MRAVQGCDPLHAHISPRVHTCMRNPLVKCNLDTGRTAPRANNTTHRYQTLGVTPEEPVGPARLRDPAGCPPWSNESSTNRHEHGRMKKRHPFMAATRPPSAHQGLRIGVGSSAPGNSSHPDDLASHRMEKGRPCYCNARFSSHLMGPKSIQKVVLVIRTTREAY